MLVANRVLKKYTFPAYFFDWSGKHWNNRNDCSRNFSVGWFSCELMCTKCAHESLNLFLKWLNLYCWLTSKATIWCCVGMVTSKFTTLLLQFQILCIPPTCKVINEILEFGSWVVGASMAGQGLHYISAPHSQMCPLNQTWQSRRTGFYKVAQSAK